MGLAVCVLGGRTAVNDGGFSAIAGEIGENPAPEKKQPASTTVKKNGGEKDKSADESEKKPTEGEKKEENKAKQVDGAQSKKQTKNTKTVSTLDEEDTGTESGKSTCPG